MMLRLAFALVLLGIGGGSAAIAGDAEDIQSMLFRQVEEWNRGDVEKFVSYYSEDCVFAGSEVSKGRAGVLARYKRTYPNKDAMGRTTFSDLEVQLLGKQYAKVLGRWRLERSAAAGGATGGFFTLIVRKQARNWMIIHDHTSVGK